jgi:hypothetical protein
MVLPFWNIFDPALEFDEGEAFLGKSLLLIVASLWDSL